MKGGGEALFEPRRFPDLDSRKSCSPSELCLKNSVVQRSISIRRYWPPFTPNSLSQKPVAFSMFSSFMNR